MPSLDLSGRTAVKEPFGETLLCHSRLEHTLCSQGNKGSLGLAGGRDCKGYWVCEKSPSHSTVFRPQASVASR